MALIRRSASIAHYIFYQIHMIEVLPVGANHLFLSIFDSYYGPNKEIRNEELRRTLKVSLQYALEQLKI